MTPATAPRLDDLRHMPIAQAAEVAALREMWARTGDAA